MSGRVGQIIDIAGALLFAGLLFRFGPQASGLISNTVHVGIQGAQAVSLQPVSSFTESAVPPPSTYHG